jgi:hypothetical protein
LCAFGFEEEFETGCYLGKLVVYNQITTSRQCQNYAICCADFHLKFRGDHDLIVSEEL